MEHKKAHRSLSKLFIFMMGFFVFVIQPVQETTNLIVYWGTKIAQVDLDKDTAEDKEKQEKQEKEGSEKDLAQSEEASFALLVEKNVVRPSRCIQKLYLDFVSEIQIPPPEVV